ncbi:MAG: hypothetical protein R2815_09480 [Flavobacteriales bacterium]|nr:hypothetical protein [Flavobacteriales bacterium]
MLTTRSIPVLCALLASSWLSAQNDLRITDVTALSGTIDPATDKAAMAGLQAAGLPDEQVKEVMAHASPDQWPPGLRTDSARTANATAARNYVAQRVCTYLDSDRTMEVVRIPVMANIHMPDELRMPHDFHLLLPSTSVEVMQAVAQRPKPSKGPAYGSLPSARITRPDGVFATYDLSTDPAAIAALEKRGLSGPEIDAVVFRSQERNWPEGMDSFAERASRSDKFKKFKAYRAAKWDGKVLLIIPAEANKRLPQVLRPYLDIYMVFEEEAVAVAGKHR